jgi:hypothetical protein
MENKQSAKPATDSQIRKILGSATDDDLVLAIRATAASFEEVLQAFEWLDDDNYMGKNRRKPVAGKAGEVFALLAEDRDAGSDRR